MRKSWQTYFGLNDKDMKTILDYFLYGMDRDLSREEQELVDNLLSSQKYFDLVKDLVRFHGEGEKWPEKYFYTNANTYDFMTSYTLWRRQNNRSFDQQLEGLNSTVVEMFKLKYFKIILAQYKHGQMIPSMEWAGAQVHHSPGADTGTDFGQCEWISPLVHMEEPWSTDYRHVPVGSFPGDANGLKMILDAEAFDSGPSDSKGIGFKISVLHHLDVPLMSNNGMNIDVGTYTQLGVAAKVVKTSQEAKSTFEPEKRGCFFEDEIRMVDVNMDIAGRYEMTNCLFQATCDQIRERCKCNLAPYEIKPNICVGKGLACLKKVNAEVGKWNEVLDTLTNTKKTCIAACETTSFSDIIISTSRYPNMNTFIYTKESCIIGKKLIYTCEDARRVSLEEWYPGLCNQIEYLNANDGFCKDGAWDLTRLKQNNSDFNFADFSSTLARYAKENIAFVTLFMREPFAEELAINVDTTTLDFISTIGGLLGLCMGFSFVTVAEMFYYGFDTMRQLCFPSVGEKSPFSRRENRKIEAVRALNLDNKSKY